MHLSLRFMMNIQGKVRDHVHISNIDLLKTVSIKPFWLVLLYEYQNRSALYLSINHQCSPPVTPSSSTISPIMSFKLSISSVHQYVVEDFIIQSHAFVKRGSPSCSNISEEDGCRTHPPLMIFPCSDKWVMQPLFCEIQSVARHRFTLSTPLLKLSMVLIYRLLNSYPTME